MLAKRKVTGSLMSEILLFTSHVRCHTELVNFLDCRYYVFLLRSMASDPANNGLAGDGLLWQSLQQTGTIWQVCLSTQHT